MVYYAYFHFIVNYGLIFCGKSSQSAKIFKIQKNIIRSLEDVEVEIHAELYLRI
jgi:hypothetical protein